MGKCPFGCQSAARNEHKFEDLGSDPHPPAVACYSRHPLPSALRG